MSNDTTLPLDIIEDRLSRLSIKSLCRFNCVSPLWKSLISERHFAKTHLNRTQGKTAKYPAQKIITIIQPCGNLISVDYDINPTPTKLEFPTVEPHDGEKWVQVLNSCNGLLLVSRTDKSLNYLVSRTDKSLFLLNPSTRECKKLPICPFLQNSVLVAPNPYGVFYDSSNDYKILMANYHPHGIRSYTTIWSVYSLKTNSWRRIEDPQFQFSGQNKPTFIGYPIGKSGGVLLNGCLHYLWWNTNGHYTTILAFDLFGEIFREVPLPLSTSFCGTDHLVILGGTLCVVDGLGGKVWMMKEYGARESWTKFTMYYASCILDVVCMLAEDEFLLFENIGGERQLVVYNPKKLTKRVIWSNPSRLRYGGTYVESLVSPFHVGGIGSQI